MKDLVVAVLCVRLTRRNLLSEFEAVSLIRYEDQGFEPIFVHRGHVGASCRTADRAPYTQRHAISARCPIAAVRHDEPDLLDEITVTGAP